MSLLSIRTIQYNQKSSELVELGTRRITHIEVECDFVNILAPLCCVLHEILREPF